MRPNIAVTNAPRAAEHFVRVQRLGMWLYEQKNRGTLVRCLNYVDALL